MPLKMAFAVRETVAGHRLGKNGKTMSFHLFCTTQVTEEKINVAREAYRPCAKRAAILFFVLSDLGSIDTMYQFSLDSYVTLFTLSINKSSENIRTDSVQNRVKTLNDWHTLAVYNNTCRGLFEKHKLLFSFHMCARILQVCRGALLPRAVSCGAVLPCGAVLSGSAVLFPFAACGCFSFYL